MYRLCEKFYIHCKPEKAAALENLSKQFLDSILERSYPKSDAHYGTLLFLLCLSESPVNADYHPSPATPPPHGTNVITIIAGYIHDWYGVFFFFSG